VTQLAIKAIEFGEKSRSFNVTEVSTNRKPVCDFLVVINSNWQPIS